MLLEGKVALVTGASRGIGREIAISLANEGATVIVNYNGSKEKAEAVVDEIIKAGGKAESIGCSVADFTGVENMISSVTEKYGKIDILVNNAGITRDGLLMKMSESDYDDVISTNLKGTFNCVRHVSRQMLKQRSGRIINISSVVGLSGNAGQANYASSKAGIIGLTKSAAKELASRGITVNAVAPGYVDTEMTQVLSDAVRENVLAQIPMKRMGNTKDIANVVVFLASDMAAYVTGQVLSVDGGMHI
ncbi:MAG: 3-oxoacyl-[acyl-carrier-protein] reductase [Clostridia bacterium]|nr:3-oxoacyl-[acyl-carrier-protein] reductase [Clostridia bacterium]